MVSNWLIVFAVSNAMLLPEMGNRLDVYLYNNSARPSTGGLMHRYCFPDYQSSFFSYYTKYATQALLASRASVTNSKHFSVAKELPLVVFNLGTCRMVPMRIMVILISAHHDV